MILNISNMNLRSREINYTTNKMSNNKNSNIKFVSYSNIFYITLLLFTFFLTILPTVCIILYFYFSQIDKISNY